MRRGSADRSTEGAVHPVQVDVATRDEAQQECRRRRRPGAEVGRRRGHRSRVPSGRHRIHRGPDRGSGITGAATLGGVPAAPFGIYVHVPFCAARCGYCDFNTYTPSELAGSGASPDGWLDAVRRELSQARSDGGGAAGRHGVRRGRDAVAARCAAARRGARRRPVDVRAGPGRRGDDGEQPGVDLAGVLRGAGRGRVHAGVAGDAVGGAARAAGAGAPAHAGAGGRGGAGGARGRARARQPRPDLRHARGDRRRPARVAGRRAGGRGGPRLGVRADRRGRHRAGPARRARRAARAGRRRGRGAVRADRRRALGRGPELVRGVELGGFARGGVPAQPRLLARRRLVGAGPRRALAPGGRAVVEREAPGALRGAAGGGGVAGGRSRGADRRRTGDGARDAAAAPGVGVAAVVARRRGPRGGGAARARTACSTRRR